MRGGGQQKRQRGVQGVGVSLAVPVGERLLNRIRSAAAVRFASGCAGASEGGLKERVKEGRRELLV
jgi:hypothetical protein